MRASHTVIDLFAGAGLLSGAFAAEGFTNVGAVEMEQAAARTYRANLGDTVTVSDVRHVTPFGKCDVLVAGPPCQGFSTLGRRDPKDPRNSLSLHVARWARKLQPRIVVVENVQAFPDSVMGQRLQEELARDGYALDVMTHSALEFGVPQLRRRSFVIAYRGERPRLRRCPGSRPLTVREAWRGLPRRPNNRNNHFSPTPSALALARMRVIPVGGDKRDVMRSAPDLAPRSWFRARSELTDVWGRLSWGKPANTLRTCLTNPSKGRYIHPTQNRVMSLREAARLHSIPDTWVFVGTHTQIARQIGNSVPMRMGRALARAVRRALRDS